jgi:Helix-turn-helix domain
MIGKFRIEKYIIQGFKSFAQHKYGYAEKPRRAFKGVWIPAEIWLFKGLTPMEKLVLIEIHSLDGEKGCWANNSHFAELFEVSIRRIQQTIEKLKKTGFISVQVDQAAGNHRVMNVLTLTPNPLPSRNIVHKGNEKDFVSSRNKVREDTQSISYPSKSSKENTIKSSIQVQKSESNLNEPFKNLEELLEPLKQNSERTLNTGPQPSGNAKESLLFSQKFATPSVFEAEMLSVFPNYQNVDFEHYFKKAAKWSIDKNIARFDWCGTVNEFIQNDEKQGKVKFLAKPKTPRAFVSNEKPRANFEEFVSAYDALTSGSFEEFTLRLNVVATEFMNAIKAGAIAIVGDNAREELFWQRLNQGTTQAKEAYFQKHQNEMLV